MPLFSLSPKGGNYGYSFPCFLNMLACLFIPLSTRRLAVSLSVLLFVVVCFVHVVVVSRDFILGATPPTPAAFLCTKPQGEKGRSKGAEQESFLRLLASHPSLFSHVKQTNPTSPQTHTHTHGQGPHTHTHTDKAHTHTHTHTHIQQAGKQAAARSEHTITTAAVAVARVAIHLLYMYNLYT